MGKDRRRHRHTAHTVVWLVPDLHRTGNLRCWVDGILRAGECEFERLSHGGDNHFSQCGQKHSAALLTTSLPSIVSVDPREREGSVLLLFVCPLHIMKFVVATLVVLAIVAVTAFAASDYLDEPIIQDHIISSVLSPPGVFFLVFVTLLWFFFSRARCLFLGGGFSSAAHPAVGFCAHR